MPTLLILKGPHGTIAKCGPSCYNSIFQECSCICRGSNHGQGYNTSIANSLNLISRFKKDYPDIQLSLHSRRALAKLKQTKIKF